MEQNYSAAGQRDSQYVLHRHNGGRRMSDSSDAGAFEGFLANLHAAINSDDDSNSGDSREAPPSPPRRRKSGRWFLQGIHTPSRGSSGSSNDSEEDDDASVGGQVVTAARKEKKRRRSSSRALTPSSSSSSSSSANAAKRQPYNARFKESRVARSTQSPKRGHLVNRYVEIHSPAHTKKGRRRSKSKRTRDEDNAERQHSGDDDDFDSVIGAPVYRQRKERRKRVVQLFTDDDDDDDYLSHREGITDGLYRQRHNTATFTDQLLAALARGFSEIFRRKCDLVMELLIPILFIVVTIALWTVWGNREFEDTYYVNYSSPDFFKSPATAADARQYFCYGPGASQPTNGLAPCNARVGNYTCEGVDTFVPLKGESLCVYAESFKAMVAAYLVSIQGNLTRIPSLDSMILYQWSAMKAGSLLLSDTFGGTFITNRQFYAIDKAGYLYFVGTNDTVMQALEDQLASESYFFPLINGGRYRTVADAEEAMKQHPRNWGIIEIRNFSVDSYDVVVRLAAKGMADATQGVDITYAGGTQENGADLYLTSGYLTLAERVAEFYLDYVHDALPGAANFVVSSATPAYAFSPMLRYAYALVPLIFVLAFLYSVSQQTKRTVLEKEMRIREAMLIMGMKNSALYIATFVTDGAVLTAVSIISTIMVKATFLSDCDVWCLFLFFWLFSLTTIPLSGLLASFFSKARLASLMAPVIYFIIVMPTFIMTSSNSGVIIAFSLLSPSGFASIIATVLRHQLGGGFASGDLNNPHDSPSVSILLGMLVADFVFYYLLVLYFDAVLPKDWGTPKHPLFFIIDPFKACCGKVGSIQGGPDGRAEDGVFEEESYADDVVRMHGLRKEYKRGGKKFVAVNNFYWGMREGEISVLLGHNGAGKTTALNMMTGMIEPDEGDCEVYGLSVRQELSLVRNEVGFCPQHNILWPELTCRDHLEFYGRIKGLKGWELENAVCRMLYETDLMDKMNYKSKDLSGGQKRKLSISVAFVGGSRLVFLDEPTAGMDVGARRHLWSLLKSMSEYHTMMLTTHYMDEADLLGSRIGIMSQGRLKCSGSSMFLKSRLGVGYSITISVDPETQVVDVDNLVYDYVPGATVLNHNGCELSYQMPMEEANQFPLLLSAIESKDTMLSIRGYSLAATTLEEVFLKVSEDTEEEGDGSRGKPSIEPIWVYDRNDRVVTAQIRAMFVKRFWNALRDRRMQCFQIICPVACILVAMLLSLIKVSGPDELLMSHTSVYQRDKLAANYPTAQCDDWWGGDSAPVAGTTHKETHYPNSEQLSFAMFDNWFFHTQPTYGGIACQDRDLSVYTQNSVTNVLIYNGSGPHQSGINLAVFYEMLARGLVNKDISMKMSAGVMHDPDDTVQDPMKMLVTGLLIMIPFAFLPSNPVAWIVKERECGAMHQQKIAGLNFYVYWGCNFVFDLCAYLIAVLLIIIVFAIFKKEEFIAPDRIGVTFAMFVMYGFTSTTMAYFMSFWFNEHSTAQTVTMGGCFALVFLLLIVAYVLQLKPETENMSNTLRWVFRLMPTFCVGECVIQQFLLKQLVAAGQATTIWAMQPVGYALLYLAVEFPIFGILALLLDHPKLRKKMESCRYDRDAEPIIPTDEDSDVEDEREAVYEAEDRIEDTTDILRVVDMQKKYPNGKVAVKGVTFSIFPGEVFAFLGTNGAGKTTTISMLCQQFMPSGGSAKVDGYDIITDSAAALNCIGYCPQFDATFDLLTVEEHLNYYAAVHGVAQSSRDTVVDTLLTLCELTKYRESQAAQLSGGNRRKLSVAVSLMGGPKVIFLDEPSAGMDPVARRGMWTAIQCAAKHCSVVLTTHHLEEVEALADIVAIMVDGTLRCIGDKVHLKNKFGSGFEMSIRIASEEMRGMVEEFVVSSIPNATLNEFKSNRYVYALPGDVPLSHVFELIQANQDALGITDYCVSQTSIEQVFLRVGANAGVELDV